MQIPADLLRQCWVLAGPTASGKSRLGILIAQQTGAEIVSMDSMAVYRKMDIGTAKPSHEELQLVPHHLIDVVDPDQEFSTAQYLQQVIDVCQKIIERGNRPLFVGGTGLYLKAILRGVFAGPAADWEYRQQLGEIAKTEQPNWLWKQLAQVDPKTAERLHPNDHHRLIRALEIHHLTGIPASQQHQETVRSVEERPASVQWIHPPRDWLAERINLRVEQMIEQGLVEEVRQLLASEHPPGRSACQALGYRQVIEYLDGKIKTEAEMVSQIQIQTRQFAKRQHTWFRNLEECQPLEISGTESIEELSDRFQQQAASAD